MKYFGFNFSMKPDPVIDRLCKEASERAKKAKRDRLDALRRKYHDVPLNMAVIQLFWREGGLTIRDLAIILETDEGTIESEIDRAELNAR